MFIVKQSVSQKCPSSEIQEAEDAVFEKLILEVWLFKQNLKQQSVRALSFKHKYFSGFFL